MNGYWVISESALMEMLTEAHDGADPEEVFIAHYANAESHRHYDARRPWRVRFADFMSMHGPPWEKNR